MLCTLIALSTALQTVAPVLGTVTENSKHDINENPENITEILDEDQKEDIIKRILNETEVAVIKSDSGCYDYPHGSECCTVITGIPFIYEMNDSLCMNMTFKDNDTALHYHFTWNGDVKLDGDLIDFEEDICVSIPLPKVGDLFKLCIFFTQYSRVNGTLNGCVHFKLKIFSLGFNARIGCFGNSSASEKKLNIALFIICLLITISQCQIFMYSGSVESGGDDEDYQDCGIISSDGYYQSLS